MVICVPDLQRQARCHAAAVKDASINGAIVVLFDLVGDDVHTGGEEIPDGLGGGEAPEGVDHSHDDVSAAATATPDDETFFHPWIKARSGDCGGAAMR